MQMRKGPRSLGTTGLSNVWTHRWTHQYRARVPPWGVNRADALCVSPSNFCAQIPAPSNFSTKNSPPLDDVSHNSIRVSMYVYR